MTRIESPPPVPGTMLPAAKPPVQQPLRYMVQLDGLRALAVGSVMMFHYTASDPAKASAAHHAVDEGWALFANMGVTLFFVLSGFLITGILLKCREDIAHGNSTVLWSLRQFYARRFLRIFPAFYFVIAIGFVFAQQNRSTMWWHAAYLSNFYFAKQGVLVGPLAPFWSLAVEEQFYLLWPLVVLLTPAKRLPAALICMIASAIVFRAIAVWVGLNDVAILALPISCLDALGLGSLLAVRGDKAIKLERLGLRVGFILWIALIVSHIGWHGPRWELIYSRSVVAFFSVGLVAGAARGFAGPFGRFLRFRPIVYLGTISYGLYLYHNLTPRLIGPIALRAGILEKPWILIPLLALVTLAIASSSWFLYEYPINSLKRFFPYRGRPVLPKQ